MTIFVMTNIIKCGVVIFLQVIIGCALADFVVAVFHWFEDNYLPVKKYRWRVIEELAKNNAVHHARPRDILKYSVWINMCDPAIAGACIALLIFLATGCAPTSIAFLVTTSMTQPIHQFQHMTRLERPFLAHVLFMTHLIVDPRTHHLHHSSKTTQYGIVFSHLNHLYETTGVWRHLEATVWPWWGPPVTK